MRTDIVREHRQYLARRVVILLREHLLLRQVLLDGHTLRLDLAKQLDRADQILRDVILRRDVPCLDLAARRRHHPGRLHQRSRYVAQFVVGGFDQAGKRWIAAVCLVQHRMLQAAQAFLRQHAVLVCHRPKLRSRITGQRVADVAHVGTGHHDVAVIIDFNIAQRRHAFAVDLRHFQSGILQAAATVRGHGQRAHIERLRDPAHQHRLLHALDLRRIDPFRGHVGLHLCEVFGSSAAVIGTADTLKAAIAADNSAILR